MAQKMIFMGNGEHSEALCKKLHERLEEGLSHLSDSQQLTPPGRLGCPSGLNMAEWSEEQYNLQNEIMTVVEDIAVALGSKVHRMDDEMRFILEVEIPKP